MYHTPLPLACQRMIATKINRKAVAVGWVLAPVIYTQDYRGVIARTIALY